MEEMSNEMTITLTLSRHDLCNLLLACTNAHLDSGAEKWIKLHDELREQLELFDAKHDIG